MSNNEDYNIGHRAGSTDKAVEICSHIEKRFNGIINANKRKMEILKAEIDLIEEEKMAIMSTFKSAS